MLKRSLVLLLALAMVAAVAAGCAPKGPAIGGVLVQALAGANPSVFNTILSADTVSSAIEDRLFEGIVRYDENMQRIGLLAEDWNISEDNLEWTFFLKEGVKWHDGQPFTAYDVEFTFGTMAFNEDYPGPRASSFSLLEEIVVIDDHTIKFILSRPFGPFMNNIGYGIMPRHIFDPEFAEGANKVAIADMFSHPANWVPVGTGPWVFGEWKEGEYIELNRNENYHNAPEPFIATRLYKFLEDANTAIAALETGEIDMIAAIPADDYDRITTNLADTHDFYHTQRLAYDYIGFNHRPEAFGEGRVNPFTDLKVRQALAHGLNRQEFIDTFLHGRGTIMNSSIPPISWAYAEDRVTVYEYDPEIANQLLDEAGWIMDSDGFRYKTLEDGTRQKFEIVITLDAGGGRREAVTILAQEEWRTLGVDVEMNTVEWSVLLNNYVIPGNYEMIVMGWNLGGDPDSYSIFHSTQTHSLNDAAYNNPLVDELLVKGRETVDIEARKAIYADLQAELSRDLPYIFLFTEMVTSAVDKKVQGITVGALGLWYQERWFIQD